LHLQVIASVHGSSVLAASARLLSLRLRGGSPEGEDGAAAAAQPNATGRAGANADVCVCFGCMYMYMQAFPKDFVATCVSP